MGLKYFCLLLLLLLSHNLIAQDQEATLVFTDGTSLTGYGSVKWEKNPFIYPPQHTVLFRLSKKDQPDEWDGIVVDKIIFHGFEYSRTFQFVNIPFNRKPEYHLMELLEEGEVNLYAVPDSNYGFAVSVSVPIDLGIAVSAGTGAFTQGLKVKRKSEEKFTTFGGSKKKIAAYFNNCSGIVSKLKTNDFHIGTIREIVSYYNDLCAGYEEEIFEDTE